MTVDEVVWFANHKYGELSGYMKCGNLDEKLKNLSLHGISYVKIKREN